MATRRGCLFAVLFRLRSACAVLCKSMSDGAAGEGENSGATVARIQSRSGPNFDRAKPKDGPVTRSFPSLRCWAVVLALALSISH